MLRGLLIKYGPIKISVFSTIISVAVSVGIAQIINLLLRHASLDATGLVLSILVPSFITPSFALFGFSLLFQLYEIEEKLQHQATTDELTQSFNRRHFIKLATEILEETKKTGGIFSIILLDMDNFKTINDTYGHLAGDQLLKKFGEVCKSALPENAIFARYGGDEFVFLFKDAGKQQTSLITKTLRDLMATIQLQTNDGLITLRASLGIATFNPSMQDLDSLLSYADQKMYEEKRKKGDEDISRL